MRVFKNLNLGGLAALVFAGFFAISWTTIESKLAKQWYQVSVSDSDSNPEKNQHILGLYPGGTPQFLFVCLPVSGLIDSYCKDTK